MTQSTILKQRTAAQNYIFSKTKLQPEVGLILGSGLGELAEQIEDSISIPYEKIPHFPLSTVSGHAGKLILGNLEGKKVVALQGRFHYYEGYSLQKIAFPIRVMQALGIYTLIVTNACGSMNEDFLPGDLMVIRDHVNMVGENPLIGKTEPSLGVRFPDMTQAYSLRLQKLAHHVAKEKNIHLQEGVYVGVAGPSFMTPTELKMLRFLGGDVVGMSTVPEVIVANHMKLQVLGLSCVTDMAIAEKLEPLTHQQVMSVANQTKPRFCSLLTAILANL